MNVKQIDSYKYRPMRREVWIDQVRGFAMFLVLMSHGETKVMHEMYVFLMLPLFFAISGYLHKNVLTPNWKKLADRIIFRIGIPYLFFTILWLFEELLRTRNIEAFQSYIIDIITGRTFWFLPCLAAVELYSVVFDYLICKVQEYRNCGIGVKVLVVLVGIVSMYLVKKQSNCPFYLDTAITALAFYYMGNCLREFKLPVLKSVYRFIPILFFILYLWLSHCALSEGILFNMSTNDNDYPLITCIISVIGILSTIFAFRSFNFGKVWEMLGKNTMLVYGINLYALCIGRFVADRLPFAPDGGYIWTITEVAIAVVVCLLCSYPVNRWFPLVVGNKIKKN